MKEEYTARRELPGGLCAFNRVLNVNWVLFCCERAKLYRFDNEFFVSIDLFVQLCYIEYKLRMGII